MPPFEIETQVLPKLDAIMMPPKRIERAFPRLFAERPVKLGVRRPCDFRTGRGPEKSGALLVFVGGQILLTCMQVFLDIKRQVSLPGACSERENNSKAGPSSFGSSNIDPASVALCYAQTYC